MLRLWKAISGIRKYMCIWMYRTWSTAAVLLVALALLSQFVSLLWKESQLVRREQVLNRMYEEILEIVQVAEQTTRRIEENLNQHRQNLGSIEANIQEMSHLSAQISSPVELPLEPAPSR
jgi:septal ring factor EnvC (AmiA/AmiB activator)